MFNLFSKNGNAEIYSPDKINAVDNSPLKNKKVFFLGSSVTYGSAADGFSFADFLQKKHGIIMQKEAVPGTTLADNDDTSYIARLKNADVQQTPDIFVCQLSTNDVRRTDVMGEISSSYRMEDFDTKTIAGAIEYIVVYAKEKFDCPVIFYTNPVYDCEKYSQMVSLLLGISEKYGFSVIDLWNNKEINDISEKERKLYMADKIHPTLAGYGKWWLPEFEKALLKTV